MNQIYRHVIYTQGLDDFTVTAESKFSFDFTASNFFKFCNYNGNNGSNSYFHVNGVKIYQSTAKTSEFKPNLLRLGNFLKDCKLIT